MPQQSYTMQDILNGALDKPQQAQRSYSMQEILSGALDKPPQQGPVISPQELAQRQAAAKKAADANAPSLLGGFASEAWKNTKNLGAAIMKPTTPGVQVSTGMESTGNRALDLALGALGSGVPGGQGTEGMGLADAIKYSPGVNLAKDIGRKIQSLNPFATGADQATIKAIRNIQQLSPTTKEANATAYSIANEALERGSVPEAKNFAVRDSKVYQNLLNAQHELEQAKAATPLAQQQVNGKTLLNTLNEAVAREEVPSAVRPQYGMETTSANGGEYTPITSFQEAEAARSGRHSAFTKIRDQVANLMDNNGNIRGDRLQKLKEVLDQGIQDHNGWSETAQAADRSNLAALRKGNGYVRQTLRDLDNARLNAANDNFSHQADIAKIVDLRRTELGGLPTAEKIQKALVPPKGQPFTQFVRKAARAAAPYLPPAALIGGGAYYEATKK